MLNIYLSKDFEPNNIGLKLITDIDSYFTTIKVDDTDVNRRLINEIDYGKYLDSISFIDRFGFKEMIQHLSTGCKTALLTVNNPHILVDSLEMGVNARDSLIRNGRNGSLYLHYNDVPICFSGEDLEVDINLTDINHTYHFTSLDRLNYYLMYESDSCELLSDLPGVELIK